MVMTNAFWGNLPGYLKKTMPYSPRYQIRFLLEVPLAVNAGQHVEGTLKMEAFQRCWLSWGVKNYPLVN